MKALLVQLPIPRINLGLNTGNIPLAGACLAKAAATVPGWQVEVLSEAAVSWAGDQALVEAVCSRSPDLLGFTAFAWNVERSIFLARQIKEKTGVTLVFGGPQVTEDTLRDFPGFIDFLVLGEGEAVFQALLADLGSGTGPGIVSGIGAGPGSASLPKPAGKSPQILTRTSQGSLLAQGSPYCSGHLGLGPGQVMLLETQRGCPYKCGFCFYSKARKKRDIAEDRLVLEGLTWALENGAKEIYLMDPSFNARPGIKPLLDEIAALNRRDQIPIISEIRAESVTPALADRYARAGFTQFEVGLQSTNPKALSLMNRPTDLDRFVAGVRALEANEIAATIDLIFGLPGDTPQGFRQSVDFLLDHGLDRHVQVFPLLVLPGTAFRKEARALNLEFISHPPYPVTQTPAFSRAGLEAALDYAEEAFDRAFLPFPDLEISFVSPRGRDHYICPDRQSLLAKLVLDSVRPLDEIRDLARKVASPFQIFFAGSALDPDYLTEVTAQVSSLNPFVPLELVFLNPQTLPDTARILAAAGHRRPHFLDLDQQYLYPEQGNRSLLFTLVTPDPDPVFQGPMQRQVLVWPQAGLPGPSLLGELSHLDGLLIQGQGPGHLAWQDVMAQLHDDLLPICFSDLALELRWLSLTEPGKYHLPALQGAVDLI